MFPTQECASWSFCCSTTLPANDIASVLDFSQFQRYVVLSHYYSTWIPQWQTCWASFHILLSHLRIFFCKMSTQIFVCSYFNWVVFLLLNKDIILQKNWFLFRFTQFTREEIINQSHHFTYVSKYRTNKKLLDSLVLYFFKKSSTHNDINLKHQSSAEK